MAGKLPSPGSANWMVNAYIENHIDPQEQIDQGSDGLQTMYDKGFIDKESYDEWSQFYEDLQDAWDDYQSQVADGTQDADEPYDPNATPSTSNDDPGTEDADGDEGDA